LEGVKSARKVLLGRFLAIYSQTTPEVGAYLSKFNEAAVSTTTVKPGRSISGSAFFRGVGFTNHLSLLAVGTKSITRVSQRTERHSGCG
jgi:hypothetical protein